MADILWLNWSGGGNLPPSLGIARMLTERGHRVAFAGRPEMVPRVERAGFRAIELTRAYEWADRYPPNKWLPKAASFLTSPAIAEQIEDCCRPKIQTSLSSITCFRWRKSKPRALTAPQLPYAIRASGAPWTCGENHRHACWIAHRGRLRSNSR